MTRVTVDSATGAKLSNVNQTSEVCDEAGRVLGLFTPNLAEKKEPKITEEELKRREQKGGGRQLAVILADLEKNQ